LVGACRALPIILCSLMGRRRRASLTGGD
jgi:hypothetical protein